MDYKKYIAGKISAGENVGDLSEFIEVPPDRTLGDYALPCFKLSKILRLPTRGTAKPFV